MGEDLFPRLENPHVSGHLHSLVDYVGLACSHVYGGESAFGWYCQLDRSHEIDMRAFCNAGCGFELEEASYHITEVVRKTLSLGLMGPENQDLSLRWLLFMW